MPQSPNHSIAQSPNQSPTHPITHYNHPITQSPNHPIADALFLLTAASFLGGVLASLGGHAVPARLFFMATVLFAAITFVFYWQARGAL
jgi:hypothetical protein